MIRSRTCITALTTQFISQIKRILLEEIVYQDFFETLENLYIYEIALYFILDKLKIWTWKTLCMASICFLNQLEKTPVLLQNIN